MNNLLIIEGDLIQSHFLINSICKKIQKTRLCGVISTGKEAMEFIKNNDIDVIILDLELPDMLGVNIINHIDKNRMSKYKSSIIVITEEMAFLEEIIHSEYVFSYYSKNNDIDFLISQIKELLIQKQKLHNINSIRSYIKKELEYLKYNFTYIGTRYLHACIYECYYKANINDVNLNKDVYPTISKKYNKNVNTIKSSIFQATTVMYNENNKQFISKYFGYNVISKPRTKEIIFTILEKIRDIKDTI